MKTAPAKRERKMNLAIKFFNKIISIDLHVRISDDNGIKIIGIYNNGLSKKFHCHYKTRHISLFKWLFLNRHLMLINWWPIGRNHEHLDELSPYHHPRDNLSSLLRKLNAQFHSQLLYIALRKKNIFIYIHISVALSKNSNYLLWNLTI